MPTLGGRQLRVIVAAAFKAQHHKALLNMFRVYPRPLPILSRYLLRTGTYPSTMSIRTRAGMKEVRLFSHDDLLTLNEIFCREDYRISPLARTIVDFGSNIGISALYFLTESPGSRVYLFEPLPQNIARLKVNLRGFEDRYELHPLAVGTTDGEFEFGYESTGRYGGLEKKTGQTIRVACREVNGVLADILNRAPDRQIDLLKIDIEGIEEQVVRGIHPEHLERIRAIYAEASDPTVELNGFVRSKYGGIVRWIRTECSLEPIEQPD